MESPIEDRTIADRVLLMTLRAWGVDIEPAFWGRFRPRWRESLKAAWEREPLADPESVREELLRAHAAEARPDPAHIHPSWWVRALKDESPSVRHLVAAHGDRRLRAILRRGLDLDPADLVNVAPPHPDALGWVLGLWSERIVGDLPEWPGDPPVIVALTRFGLRGFVDLARATGLVKLALAKVHPPPLGPRSRDRLEAFRQIRAGVAPSTRALARRDFLDLAASTNRRPRNTRGWGRLGLITFGRLLAPVEPYRARWALQHLPYSIARAIRRSIQDPDGTMATDEAEILRIARERLSDEGRLRENLEEAAPS